MTPASAKQKGRKFQQWIRDRLLELFPSLTLDDVHSRSMGAGGEDIMLSPKARDLFPYSIEAKNVERLNVWEAYGQAAHNALCSDAWEGGIDPILFIKKNHKKPLIVVDADHFFLLLQRYTELKKNNEKSDTT